MSWNICMYLNLTSHLTLSVVNWVFIVDIQYLLMANKWKSAIKKIKHTNPKCTVNGKKKNNKKHFLVKVYISDSQLENTQNDSNHNWVISPIQTHMVPALLFLLGFSYITDIFPTALPFGNFSWEIPLIDKPWICLLILIRRSEVGLVCSL